MIDGLKLEFILWLSEKKELKRSEYDEFLEVCMTCDIEFEFFILWVRHWRKSSIWVLLGHEYDDDENKIERKTKIVNLVIIVGLNWN